MKRAISIFLFSAAWVCFSHSALAQDDQYYDPNKDSGSNHATQNYAPPQPNNNTSELPVDKTDGYGNPADKYDLRDNYSSNNNYTNEYSGAYSYDDDYNYYYTTRLYRYYRPNYGVNYYSYWFTPSYFCGYSTWNPTYYVSYSPWYNDSWWRWNRRPHTTVIVYDPFYDPYWSWNFGWNSSYYYNSWNNPYWGYHSCYNYGGFNSWGWNGWGYNNGGFCGGFYNNYYNNYYSGYNNGYWNGYNNGWNSAYGYGGYYDPYYYYHHHRSSSTDGSQPPAGNGKVTVTNTASANVVKPKANGEIELMDIPKEGITKPFISNTSPKNNGVSVGSTTVKPYQNANNLNDNNIKTGVNMRPGEENIGLQNSHANRWDNKTENIQPFNRTETVPEKYNGTNLNYSGKYQTPENSKPGVLQNNANQDPWHTVPPDRWSNKPNVQHERPQVTPQQPTQQNNWNENRNENRWSTKPSVEQPRTSQPPSNVQREQSGNNWNRVEPRNENPQIQQRNNFEPRNNPPRMNVQPRQEYQQNNLNRIEPRNERPGFEPRSNFSAPQQKSFGHTPNAGGGNFRKH